MPRCSSVCVARSANPNCVRTVSRTPRNRGATPSSTGTPRSTTLLREVADRECVGMIQCASARVKGINFQACSFSLRPRQHFRDIHGERYGRGPTQERHSAPNTTVHKTAVQSRFVLAQCNLRNRGSEHQIHLRINDLGLGCRGESRIIAGHGTWAQGVAGSNPAAPTSFQGFIPVTWVTVHSEHIGNTFGVKGFSIGSSRHVSSSK
jgi:hypothetical protein